MIAQIRGEVVHRDSDTVIVDVGGVGYLVYVAAGDGIPPRGQTVVLHTSLQVREDSMTLYGFPDRDGLSLFELLLTSSGVGPKLGLAALRTLRPDVLRTAIAAADTATLTAIPGVGKKVAERMILELRDKIGALGAGDPILVGSGGAIATPLGEVREALQGLGYGAAEIQPVLVQLDPDGDVADLLRLALRQLGRATR